MELVRLSIKNFLIIEEADIDFADIGLASIVGRWHNNPQRSNGAGKSTIVEAIRYALFDQIRSKKKTDIIRLGALESTVSLTFKVRAKTVQVTRTRKQDGGKVKLTIDGKLAGTKSGVVTHSLKELLGIDSDMFDTIYYFKQMDQFTFCNAGPTERKAFLAKVLRLDSLGKCSEVAKERRTHSLANHQKAKGEVEALQNQLDGMRTQEEIDEDILEVEGVVATAEMFEEIFEKQLADSEATLAEYVENKRQLHQEISTTLDREEELASRMQEAMQRVAKLQQDHQRRTAECAPHQQQQERCKERLQQLKDVEHYSVYERTLEEMRKEEHKMIEKRAHLDAQLSPERELPEAGTKCPTCDQVVTIEYVEGINQAAHNHNGRILAEIDAVTKDYVAYRKDMALEEGRIVSAREKSGLESQLKQVKETLKGMRKEMARVEEEIVESIKERDALAAEHSELSVKSKWDDTTQLQLAVDRFQAPLETMVEQARAEALHHTDGRHTGKQVLVSYQNESNFRNDVATRLMDACSGEAIHARGVEVNNRLVEAFGRNGIQALVVENSVGIIEQFANQMLADMDTRFEVELRTQKDAADGTARESLDIIVHDNGIEKSYDLYSGGEKTLINLAIRLALSRIISSLHGVEVKCLFLDEVLSALDEVNRSEAVKVIAYLAKNFKQVFVISHTDTVRDVIESTIGVVRHQYHSKVEITDGRENYPAPAEAGRILQQA